MDNSVKENREVNPRKTRNIFSLLTFTYTFGLFKKGIKRNLDEQDIYEVLGTCNSKVCGNKTEKQMKTTKSLFSLLIRQFGMQYMLLLVIHLAWTITHSVLQPLAISRFISYFQAHQTQISQTNAYCYAALVVFLNVFHTFYWHNYLMFENKLSIRIRVSVTSVLYRKLLRMSPEKLADSTGLGNLVTILTKDVKSIEHNMWMLHDFVVATIQTLTVAYLMYAKMGNPAFLGIGFMLIGLPFQIYFGYLVKQMRLKVGKMSDIRLQVTQEVFSTIRIIKMYTWELFFNGKINNARRTELSNTIKVFYIRLFIISFGVLSSKLTFPILIITYVKMNYPVTTELVFYLLGLFRDLRHSLGILMPMALSNTAEIYASLIRIQRAFVIDELRQEDNDKYEKNYKSKYVEMNNVKICIHNDTILDNISIKIADSGLNVITGHVGSGKSSFFKAILKDYQPSHGSINVNGSISYASQEPWLFPSTIKQNILFGLPFDKEHYEKVIQLCSLKYDLSLLPHGDDTIVSDRGMNLSKGQQCRINLARAIYKRSDIYLLDDSLAALDTSVQESIFNICIKNYLSDKLVLLVTQNPSHIKAAKKVIVMESGRITSITKPEELINENDFLQNEFVTQKNLENTNSAIIVKDDINNLKNKLLEPSDDKCEVRKVYQETKREGKVPIDIYLKYFKFGGGLILFSLVIGFYVAAQSTESYAQKLISKWVNYQQDASDLQPNSTFDPDPYTEAVEKKNYTLNLYMILILVAAAISLIKSYAVLRFCRTASMRIHQAMSLCVIHASMIFFDNNFLGNILNRFSYDLDNIDEGFPFLFFAILQSSFAVVGDIVLIVTVHWIFIVLAVIFFGLLYLVKAVYIPTGRALKRLEAMNRSPMVGHLNASLEGLTTIRAYKAEKILSDEFDKHQDLYSSTYYMVQTAKQSFGFYSDLAGSCFVVSVVLVFLFGQTGTSVGDVGLVLTQVLAMMNHVQWTIKEWTDMENQMTSMERVLEYTTIAQEDKSGGAVNNWPENGEIQYNNVSLCYKDNNKVLKNISFIVKPKTKLGIVGRTGAGKSSIIQTIFRLYEIEGQILIDNVDIRGLSINFLRKNIAIIPQDPIIFDGTVRDNIDPYKIYTDAEIWDALDKIKIKHLISNLSSEMASLSFSSGQKQLLSIARAIIRKNTIVVMDEATANVDAETDQLITKAIEDNFSDCTMIIIAHRLKSIMNCDAVIVLDDGEIVQNGSPSELLGDVNGQFYKLTKQSGL